MKNSIFSLIHPVVLKALSIFRKFDLVVEGSISQKQCIFIANHFCVHDIPTAAEVIKKHTYVLVSDEDKHTFNGLLLSLNGIVWIHRTSKQDRQKAYEKMVNHLQKGHNLLMYPEATWNLTPELPMLPMNWGVVKLSKETGVPICPIYLFFTDNTCYAKIGNLFVPTGDASEDIKDLRNSMATLYWDLLEKQPMGNRTDIPADAYEQSIKVRYDEYARARKDPVGVQKYESQFIFEPKGVVKHSDAFAHLETLIPNHSNAFLFQRSVYG